MDLGSASISALASALRSGETSARELLEQARKNDRHGAYLTVDEARSAREAAAADALFAAGVELGPLQGLPVSVKDLYGVPGYPTFAGSPRRLPEAFERAGPLVARLRAGGAVITGKTHTVELAFGGLGMNAHHPVPRNPWSKDQHRVPGGSSSGAGVSLAEGSAVLALGTDTSGSVRIPASWTGNVALKTTKGRWPTEGIVPLSTTLDTAGLLARTIADLTIGFSFFEERAPVLSDAELDRVRLARMDDFFFEDCSPGVAEAVDRAWSALERAGARTSTVKWPEVREAHAIFKTGQIAAVEVLDFLSRELPAWLSTLDPNVARRVALASELKAADYLRSRAALTALAASVDARFSEVDALVTPTVPNTPPLVSAVSTPDDYTRENLRSLRNTSVVSCLGLCAVTLPIGRDAAGMPVGLQLIARAGGEARLLALAAAVEARC
jgi:aspartyl-tRNA(Asn)/glutamyl-tRNA(Gln) amidotransferase subunit A